MTTLLRDLCSRCQYEVSNGLPGSCFRPLVVSLSIFHCIQERTEARLVIDFHPRAKRKFKIITNYYTFSCQCPFMITGLSFSGPESISYYCALSLEVAHPVISTRPSAFTSVVAMPFHQSPHLNPRGRAALSGLLSLIVFPVLSFAFVQNLLTQFLFIFHKTIILVSRTYELLCVRLLLMAIEQFSQSKWGLSALFKVTLWWYLRDEHIKFLHRQYIIGKIK